MALNGSRHDRIIARREAVARLRLRGMTQRAIAAALARLEPPIADDNGKPFSISTVNIDLKILKRQWQEMAAQSADVQFTRQLAEIQEGKRAAWEVKDLNAVARFLGMEIELTGTSEPIKVMDVSGLDDGERARRITALLDTARARRDGQLAAGGDELSGGAVDTTHPNTAPAPG